ncbi:MAG: dual specificity protein phosphatase family protein [Coxiellaceae bacterium]|nr:dual specificity protein phosphatase family protein [Coxiellaceae bacterium]
MRLPRNYREVDITLHHKFKQKTQIIAGMGQPLKQLPSNEDSSETKAYSGAEDGCMLEECPEYVNETMHWLKTHGTTTILNLHETRDDHAAAEAKGLKYINMPLKDFESVTSKNLDQIYSSVTEAMSNNEQVVIHCGAGNGRTAVALASLKIHEALQQQFITGKPFKKVTASTKIALTETVTFTDSELDARCTPITKAAIDLIRAAGYEGTNNGANSIEKPGDIDDLNKHEKVLNIRYGFYTSKLDKDPTGQTAYTLALDKNIEELATLLDARGYKLSAENIEKYRALPKKSQTPLMKAVIARSSAKSAPSWIPQTGIQPTRSRIPPPPPPPKGVEEFKQPPTAASTPRM